MQEEYKDALCLLCRQSAILEQYHLMIQEGKQVDEEAFVYHMQLLVKAKESFLQIKRKLGQEGALSFMDDANFCGFRFINGCLTGDYAKLPDIVLDWIEQEGEKDSYFKYEVGILLLSHYLMQKGLYRYEVDNLLKKIPFLVRGKIWLKKIFGLFKRKGKGGSQDV